MSDTKAVKTSSMVELMKKIKMYDIVHINHNTLDIKYKLHWPVSNTMEKKKQNMDTKSRIIHNNQPPPPPKPYIYLSTPQVNSNIIG